MFGVVQQLEDEEVQARTVLFVYEVKEEGDALTVLGTFHPDTFSEEMLNAIKEERLCTNEVIGQDEYGCEIWHDECDCIWCHTEGAGYLNWGTNGWDAIPTGYATVQFPKSAAITEGSLILVEGKWHSEDIHSVSETKSVVNYETTMVETSHGTYPEAECLAVEHWELLPALPANR